jgi:hypothetical protein
MLRFTLKPIIQNAIMVSVVALNHWCGAMPFVSPHPIFILAFKSLIAIDWSQMQLILNLYFFLF